MIVCIGAALLQCWIAAVVVVVVEEQMELNWSWYCNQQSQ
jgi:hypothetical protein